MAGSEFGARPVPPSVATLSQLQAGSATNSRALPLKLCHTVWRSEPQCLSVLEITAALSRKLAEGQLWRAVGDRADWIALYSVPIGRSTFYLLLALVLRSEAMLKVAVMPRQDAVRDATLEPRRMK